MFNNNLIENLLQNISVTKHFENMSIFYTDITKNLGGLHYIGLFSAANNSAVKRVCIARC